MVVDGAMVIGAAAGTAFAFGAGSSLVFNKLGLSKELIGYEPFGNHLIPVFKSPATKDDTNTNETSQSPKC